MRNIFLSLFFLALVFCTTANATKKAEEGHRKKANIDDVRIKKDELSLSMTDLGEAMTMVMQTVDGEEKGCSIPEDKIPQLSQGLRSLIDARYEVEAQSYIKRRVQERSSFFPDQCEKTCSCGVYISFIEYLEQSGKKLSQVEKKALAQLTKSQEMENRPICSEASQWFCQSDLLNKAISD